MRVTHGMLADTTLRNLSANTRRLERLQQQLTTGRRISKASEDPIGAARALDYHTSLAEIAQYQRNVDSAAAWLNATDSALGAVTSLLHRARELAIQGASDTLSAQDRIAAAQEVRQILQHAVQSGNAKFGQDYLFAGQKTDTAPISFDEGTLGWTYMGDAGGLNREVGPTTQIGVGVRGDAVFGPALDALADLITGLESNDPPTVQASISAIDGALDGVLVARAQTGARANRMEAAASRLGDLKVNQSDLLSKEVDLDMAEALMNYAVAENVYKASLAAGARAVQPSLLDYLP